MAQRLWLLVFVVLGACFSPEFRDGQISCGPNNQCPPGLSCVNAVCRIGNLMQDGDVNFTLTVSTSGGNGTGTVSSTPSGIDCGADCSEEFLSGTQVTLTQMASSDSEFVGWSGACTGNGPCVVTLSQNQSVTANFALNYSLVVAMGGNGQGLVTSNPAGISCTGGGSDCSEGYDPNTNVTLTGLPVSGSVFEGWSGTGATNCTSNGPCTVTMDAAKMVTATFTLQKYALTIEPAGAGTGTVASSPTGIDCGLDCSEAFDFNSMVTLTPTAGTGSVFGGWTGGNCTGTNPCTVTVTQPTTVTATWNLTQHVLTVMKAGNGAGTVTSSPGTINCGSGTDCMTSIPYNTVVTLSAQASQGSIFTGWTGATNCTGTGSCDVTVTQAQTVTATFTLTTPTLTVAKGGNGTGTVTSTNPSGIDCGATCSQPFNYGTDVTLVAAPTSSTSNFGGWVGGDCDGSMNTTCVTDVSSSYTITANFTLKQWTLTVSTTGSVGTGGLVSGNGIACTAPGDGGNCDDPFNHGTVVTLNAAPAAGSQFMGWGGACAGNGSCEVTMDMARMVTANFQPTSHTLTVNKQGTGNGTVVANVGMLDCGSDCNDPYTYNTVVQLTASEDTGSNFTGWTNAPGCTTNPICAVTVTGALIVTANYTLETHNVNVTFVTPSTSSGTVTATGGNQCTDTCTIGYPYATVVTLNAAPDPGSLFTGWSGEMCSGTGSCQVTADQVRNVTATFAVGTASLTVQKQGTGTGTVVSDIAGINCGATCSNNFANGQTVILTATPDTPSSSFTGWTGACAGAGTDPMCSLMIVSGTPLTAIANFALTNHVLTVQNVGNGAGTTTSSPGTISCPGTCSQSFAYGTDVQLFAAPSPGSSFTGWSGGGPACTGGGSCTVDVTTATTVMAQYTLNQHRLQVTKPGTGTGTVTSDVGAISCGSTCSDIYNYGTDVVLTPMASPGSTFTGWSGACAGMGPCTVDVTDDLEAIANFDINTYTVDVVIAGAGSSVNGVASISDMGIDCGNGGNDCTEVYDYNYTVQLKSNEASGYKLTSWSGGGCTGNGLCEFQVTGDTTITATFEVIFHTLTAAVSGAPGTVTASGISCSNFAGGGSDCSQAFAYGVVVGVTAAGNPAGPPGSVFTGWSGACTGTGSCSVSMTSDRSVTANFVLSTHVLTVISNDTLPVGDNDGSGSASSSPAGVTCSASNGTTSGDCDHTYNYGQTIQITASPSYGSTFTGWTGCDSVSGNGGVTCNVTLTGARSVNMQFDAVPPNYVFAVSTSSNGALVQMGLDPFNYADNYCATRAGVLGSVLPSGRTWKAWLSTSGVNAISRIGSATGWVRAGDNRPVFNTQADLTTGHITAGIRDEFGNPLPDTGSMMTGTLANGTFYTSGNWGSCSDYSSSSNMLIVYSGRTNNTSSQWTAYAGSYCSSTNLHFYCFSTDYQAVARPVAGTYRRVFTTSATWTPNAGGVTNADALCQSEANAQSLGGVWKALLALTTSSAAGRFTLSGATWARRDDAPIVATASGLGSMSLTQLIAAPNNNAAGTFYGNDFVWSGHPNLHSPVAAGGATNCNDWTSTALSGAIMGISGFTSISYLRNWPATSSCATGRKLVCLQESL